MKHVHFITEQTTIKQKVLIVTDKNDIFARELKAHLTSHDLKVFLSPHIPNDTHQFNLCFIISSTNKIVPLDGVESTTYIIFRPHKKNKPIKPPNHTKVVTILGQAEYAVTQIQTIIWFAITQQTHSPCLTLESPFEPVPTPIKDHPRKYSFSFPLAWIRICIVLLLIGYLFSFWIPLSVSSIYSYLSLRSIQRGNLKQALSYTEQKKPFLELTQTLFAPVRPVYMLFSVAQLPDDIIVINTTETKLVQTAEELIRESQAFSAQILNPNRTVQLGNVSKKRFETILQLLNLSEEYILTLYRKIPPRFISASHKNEFQQGIALLRKSKKLFTLLPFILGNENEQSFLLLFANNMELRPGGGFIGSFGILKTQYFGMKDLAIFDVYDADGQLTAHVAPPNAIRDYLAQPHWYLRDSAFFPDFYDTYQQATYFLQKEMGLSSWNGAALITTSAVKDIIGAYGELLIPDYNEKITKDNFYIKTQYEVENKFFPGSQQKKNFLSALVKQLLATAESANPLALSKAVVDGFDQKNMVFFMNDERAQKKLDELFWSGRLATPFCPTTSKDNCYADFQFPMDANLGVNKTNFFIDKLYDIKTTIDENGLTTTTLAISYKNNSLEGLFPGGPYKNYFQIILPRDAVVNGIQIDGQQLPSYDSESGNQRLVGFLLELPPQAKKTVFLSYTSSTLFKTGKATYQLVLQKQIGALPHDVHFTLSLPSNMNLLNTNFSPLVKNNLIIYNTDLSTDRVFFIELLKDHL